MKPQLLKVTANPIHSFSIRQDTVPYINNRWHYHKELELIHFKQGHGTQFIGDSIKSFSHGDVLLIGSNLPHYWRFDDCYFEQDTNISADVRVAHFCNNFWGEAFLDLPENKKIKQLLDKAKTGLLLTGQSASSAAAIMENLLQAEGTKKIILLLEALHVFANSANLLQLSSIGFMPTFKESENDRINDIYEYSLANFKRKIELREIADVANISPHSFCRYFKAKTSKTYFEFLIEVRVGNACKLLIENKISVKQVCFESGFNNFASFHKYFKKITGKSPLAYQKQYINKS